MTKEEFKELLPASITDPVHGLCKLQILADNQLIKTACYINIKKIRFGYRSSNSWAIGIWSTFLSSMIINRIVNKPDRYSKVDQ
jgi:hypothetical protein